MSDNPTAILLDIEGTTTSIAFVYETLFPFARANLRAFIEANWDDPAVQADVQAVIEQAAEDTASGVEGAFEIPDGDGRRQAVIQNLLWQMDNDRKTTGLKGLQGKIWVDGYQTGEIQGHVYSDVGPAIARWTDAGLRVYIYSSGSIAAQKLLFGHSEAGDLTPLLSGYFDTTTGPKKESKSYTRIAEAIGLAPSAVLFVTDNLAEADAAAEAGMHVRLSIRPGNPPVPDHRHPEIRTFEGLVGVD